MFHILITLINVVSHFGDTTLLYIGRSFNMYDHIQTYIEQIGYDVVEVILLFEKVDQNHADMDELNTLNRLARAVYIDCQRHNLLTHTHPPTPFEPYELIEWFVFQSYDRDIT